MNLVDFWTDTQIGFQSGWSGCSGLKWLSLAWLGLAHMHIQLSTGWLFMHSCSGPSTSRWVYIFLVFTIVTHMCLPMPAHPFLHPSTCACLDMPCFPILGGIRALSLQPTSLLPPWHFGPTFFLPQHIHYPIQLFIFWAFIWWPPACFSIVHIYTTYPSTPLPAVTHTHLPTPTFLPVPTCLHLLYAPDHLLTPTSACLYASASTLPASPLTSHPPLLSGLKSMGLNNPRTNLAAGI